MIAYKNLSGGSGITGYETASDSISIEFKNGWKYQYTNASAGRNNIEQMKLHAKQGQGLGTFIDKFSPPYSKKWR